jgi:chemotaxis protein MotB
MRNVLAIMLGLSVLGAMSAGGCCPTQEEYNKMFTANRNCQDRLKDCQDSLRLAKQDIEKLNGQIADRDNTISYLQRDNAALKKNNDDIAALLKQAQEDLKKIGNIKVGPLPEKLNEALKALADRYTDILEVKGNMVKFKSDMTFDPGSADVKPHAAEALKKLAEILNLPEAQPFNVFVAGHTDDMPLEKPATIAKFENNWGLSLGRAKAVVEALYSEGKGLAQERMAAMGFSKYHPVAPNAAGNKGNVLNRRVEIWIVPNDLFMSAPASGAAPRAGGADATTGG